MEGSEDNYFVLRTKPLPALYTQLPFLRPGNGDLADVPDKEDMRRLGLLRGIISGEACVSELFQNNLAISVEIPSCVLQCKGKTGRSIWYKMYYWKPWDIHYLVNGISPAEAVKIGKINGDISQHLPALAKPISCIPLLKETEKRYDRGGKKGYTLEPEMERSLRNLEENCF